MRVYGVIGWKNAGKTSLMERLVADITARGYTVSTIKHVHHDVDLDQPGKDSFRHRVAGASEVVLASARRFALMREHRGPEPDLTAVLARLMPVDLVLVEGYKRDTHRKIEVHRQGAAQGLIQPGDPMVRAVATDVAGLQVSVPVLDLNDTGAVADFILREVGLTVAPRPGSGKAHDDMPHDVSDDTSHAASDDAFDSVIIVDWSASAAPSPDRPSADAIWTAIAREGGVQPHYHRTRAAAEAYLVALLEIEAAAGRRVLVGFDFPMGYPAGFAARLTGQARAQAVWAWLAERIKDDARNCNNRFEVADAINRHFGGSGPFWGRPEALRLPALHPRKTVDYAALGLAERRAVERLVPRAQPVWKLFTTGSVGSQSLMGLPVVHRLAARGAGVWPFDGARARVVVAEVYPSLLAGAVASDGGAIKDEIQVRLLALALWRLSRAGRLGALFDVPGGDVVTQEGWILGAGHQAALAGAV